MDKCWYCIVEGGAKGPFTKDELLSKPYFTRESLVWKDGFSDWVPAKQVKELFAEEESESPKKPKFGELPEESVEGDGEVVLLDEKEPPNLILWLLILVLILFFYLFQMYST
ncbi:MAG: DUF4339 domain-containing protein [Chlamydiia bacterium]|nr:DUF4339 domain-containing protein [Chlamydiia bacterium]